jgi:hypothetical protein
MSSSSPSASIRNLSNLPLESIASQQDVDVEVRKISVRAYQKFWRGAKIFSLWDERRQKFWRLLLLGLKLFARSKTFGALSSDSAKIFSSL